MMTLKIKTKTINVITTSDWDDFVMLTYGKHYNFQQQDGCKSRGTFHFTPNPYDAEEFDYEATEIPFEVNGEVMGVSFETWLNTDFNDTRKHFESDFDNRLFWERNFYPDVNTIVWDLYKRGLIEECEYMIDIDW